jgi:hypothetical protein
VKEGERTAQIEVKEAERGAGAVHKKAWGHSWPRRRNAVKRAEIGEKCDGDELYLEGITDRLDTGASTT